MEVLFYELTTWETGQYTLDSVLKSHCHSYTACPNKSTCTEHIYLCS